MIDLKKQIESIIEDLGNNESISKILLKAQTIAFYLKDDTFANWIKAEQNGYKNTQLLPDYRRIHCTIQVDVSIPYRGTIYGIDFPIDAIENLKVDELKLTVSGYDTKDSCTIIEEVYDQARIRSMVVDCEGIKSMEQVKALRKGGCRLVQGSFFSPLIKPDEFVTHDYAAE